MCIRDRAGKWQHVALVLDKAEPGKLTDCLKLFLNGKQVAVGQASMNKPNWARIGGDWSTRFHDGANVEKTVALTGCVDDFAVFTKALNEEEIKNLMDLKSR